MKKLTIKDILDFKNKKQLTEVAVFNQNEALACEKAEIDMIITIEGPNLNGIRSVAKNTFLTVGLDYGKYVTKKEILKASFKNLNNGIDAIYCPQSMRFIRALTKEGIPVIGHVGFVPYKATWFGGFKAVGKTAKEAIDIYELCLKYQDAGAFAIEMEIVPHKIANKISKELEISVISLGSGKGCDIQYLFAEDILGINENKIPKHAKKYRNQKIEYEKIYNDSINAFKEYKNDVLSGNFPTKSNIIEIEKKELECFLNYLNK